MKNNQEVLNTALEKIKLEYLQNHLNINNPKINWVGLEGKINLLSEIANELLKSDDEIIKEIENVSKIISNNNK